MRQSIFRKLQWAGSFIWILPSESKTIHGVGDRLFTIFAVNHITRGPSPAYIFAISGVWELKFVRHENQQITPHHTTERDFIVDWERERFAANWLARPQIEHFSLSISSLGSRDGRWERWMPHPRCDASSLSSSLPTYNYVEYRAVFRLAYGERHNDKTVLSDWGCLIQ